MVPDLVPSKVPLSLWHQPPTGHRERRAPCSSGWLRPSRVAGHRGVAAGDAVVERFAVAGQELANPLKSLVLCEHPDRLGPAGWNPPRKCYVVDSPEVAPGSELPYWRGNLGVWDWVELVVDHRSR